MPLQTTEIAPLTDEEKSTFWSKVDKTDACWLWTGAKIRKGYGTFYRKATKEKLAVHRVSYEMANGPTTLCVLHKCDVPNCVRPDHLFIGTRGDNNRDRTRKGRAATGDRHGSRTKPGRLPSGDNHPRRLRPELVLRGDDHPLRKNPELAVRGEDHPCAKLCEEAVRRIRRHFNTTQSKAQVVRDLRPILGVSRGAIYDVINGKIWRHVA